MHILQSIRYYLHTRFVDIFTFAPPYFVLLLKRCVVVSACELLVLFLDPIWDGRRLIFMIEYILDWSVERSVNNFQQKILFFFFFCHQKHTKHIVFCISLFYAVCIFYKHHLISLQTYLSIAIHAFFSPFKEIIDFPFLCIYFSIFALLRIVDAQIGERRLLLNSFIGVPEYWIKSLYSRIYEYFNAVWSHYLKCISGICLIYTQYTFIQMQCDVVDSPVHHKWNNLL